MVEPTLIDLQKERERERERESERVRERENTDSLMDDRDKVEVGFLPSLSLFLFPFFLVGRNSHLSAEKATPIINLPIQTEANG